MSFPRTLIDALEAAAHLQDSGFSHLMQERQRPSFVSFAGIYQNACHFAAALQARGLQKGDRIGLILPDSQEFVHAIWGAMLIGVVPVPMFSPINLGQLDGYFANAIHILRRSECRILVTDQQIRPILGKVMRSTPTLRSIETYESMLESCSASTELRRVKISGDDLAFLQFTSGSTASPKGVALSHGNLVANMQAIGGAEGLQLSQETRAVSWLPLYHDMGLIGFVFTPVYFQVKHIRFISPLLFLKRPALWLRQLSEHQADITFAPNFAYGLCTSRIKEHEIVGVDLSSLRAAGCGAEPVQYHTLRQFADRFSAYGFRSTAFLPCYGLAEHSLAVTFVGLQDDLQVDWVDAKALGRGFAKPVKKDTDYPEDGVVSLVNCGRPFSGHELKVSDEQGNPLPERRVGEIWLRGPSVMRGYYEDFEQTSKAIVNDWLRTGDLGYLANGNLYICGRSKDLIIVHGRNYHPQDIEWQASHVDGVRTGNVVAFGVEDRQAGRERVIIAAESRATNGQNEEIREKIQARVLQSLGIRVDEILLLEPGTLPKTSSGKLQRTKAKKMFESMELNGSGASSNSRWNLVKHMIASQWNYVTASIAKRDL